MDQTYCERQECFYYQEDEEFLGDEKHPVSNCSFDKFIDFDPKAKCAYFRMDWQKAQKKKSK